MLDLIAKLKAIRASFHDHVTNHVSLLTDIDAKLANALASQPADGGTALRQLDSDLGAVKLPTTSTIAVLPATDPVAPPVVGDDPVDHPPLVDPVGPTPKPKAK